MATPMVPGDIIPDPAWKQNQVTYFPGLGSVNNFQCIGGEDPYNCIAHCLGLARPLHPGPNDTPVWIAPPANPAGLQTLMQQYGYTRATGGTVQAGDIEVYYINHGGACSHMHKVVNADWAQSKMGHDSLIQHRRTALNNGRLGAIVERYTRAPAPAAHPPAQPGHGTQTAKPGPASGSGGKPAPTTGKGAPAPAKPGPTSKPPPASNTRPGTNPGTSKGGKPVGKPTVPVTKTPPKTKAPPRRLKMSIQPTIIEPEAVVPPANPEAVASVSSLKTDLAQSYPDYSASFEIAFEKWKATWFQGDLSISSSVIDRAHGPEWDALMKLGTKTLPLVIEKLLDPKNIFAITLYEALEKDDAVKIDPSNVVDHTHIQRHANLVVELNHQRNQFVQEAVAEWKDHLSQNKETANAGELLAGEAYETLINLGDSITGHAMAELAKGDAKWWHELLHELVHGEKTGEGAEELTKEHLIEEWKSWFSFKEHDKAPKA